MDNCMELDECWNEWMFVCIPTLWIPVEEKAMKTDANNVHVLDTMDEDRYGWPLKISFDEFWKQNRTSICKDAFNVSNTKWKFVEYRVLLCELTLYRVLKKKCGNFHICVNMIAKLDVWSTSDKVKALNSVVWNKI